MPLLVQTWPGLCPPCHFEDLFFPEVSCYYEHEFILDKFGGYHEYFSINSISLLSAFRTLWLVTLRFCDCAMRLSGMSSGSRGQGDGGDGDGAAWKDVSPVRSNRVLIEIRNT